MVPHLYAPYVPFFFFKKREGFMNKRSDRMLMFNNLFKRKVDDIK